MTVITSERKLSITNRLRSAPLGQGGRYRLRNGWGDRTNSLLTHLRRSAWMHCQTVRRGNHLPAPAGRHDGTRKEEGAW
ncbi:hypothetical protein TPA0909_65150 [Streptomyces albus]|nr:hypothetical protein TPA0909_65150 [Streptomyces albus]